MTTRPPKPSLQEGMFWKTKTLEQMTKVEWESLCDGCARCCLEKLEDEDTGKIYFTHVSCKLLDAGLCACKDYAHRSDLVPDCVRLTPANVRTLNWLPPSCGYKLAAEGRDLYWWHPLISGDPNTVHEAGVSVPHYWLGMVLVIIFAATLGWLPPTGAGPGGSEDWKWNWEHVRHLVLPAVTMSVIPMGIIARTVRALVAETVSQEFIVGLRAKGLSEFGVFQHVVKNAAPTALAVMGIQLGYLLGGSILIETVFAWPGSGLLLNDAIFQRDLPLLQGTILVLALFFVVLNLAVDVMQTSLDPRIQRA